MEKIKCSTPDFAVENAKKLLALFPEYGGQKGEVDIDKLQKHIYDFLTTDFSGEQRFAQELVKA
ncbi:MAG: hypothetical protein J6336_02340 [Kiritimatiellae bacterium]|nr:hypothetical protein [Kiritimatiellia bacterium]